MFYRLIIEELSLSFYFCVLNADVMNVDVVNKIC